MQDKIYNIVKDIVLKLPDYNENIKLTVSYSGGVDSGVLLDIILLLFAEGMISQPRVIYFNHNLRGKESLEEVKFIKNKFKDSNIDLSIINLSVKDFAKKKSLSIESSARELRYAHYEEMIDEVNYILLAHHRDDNVETVFFNFLRGTGLNGIEGIKKIRGKYLRPLLDISKEEILKYADDNDIEYVTDSSNFKNEFSRNKIRNKIIPMIESELGRNIKNSIYNLSQNISEVNQYFTAIVSKFMSNNDNAVGFNDNLWIINREKFDKESIVIRKQLINYCLKSMGMDYNLDTGSISTVIEYIAKGKDKPINMYNYTIEVFGNNILILNKIFSENNLTKIVISSKSESKFYFDKSKVAMIKYGKIKLESKFTPFGKNKPVNVRKVLSDKKIPKIFRGILKVVSDGSKVVFIQGVGISEDIKVDEHTTDKGFILVENNYLESLF